MCAHLELIDCVHDIALKYGVGHRPSFKWITRTMCYTTQSSTDTILQFGSWIERDARQGDGIGLDEPMARKETGAEETGAGGRGRGRGRQGEEGGIGK